MSSETQSRADTRFSRRLPRFDEINALTRTVNALRAQGRRVVDLTATNPTEAGLVCPAGLLDELASGASYRYEPDPRGWLGARTAIAADYARRSVRVDPDRVVLSASTSEAYSWLFKLLCDPGSVVLVPQPSYPLFDHLTRLEGVGVVPYQLHYHGRWEVDFDSLAGAPDDARALLLVSPNNPTGSFVTRDEADRIVSVCRRRGWALVADEVFVDYPLDTSAPATEIAMQDEVLSFTLGGASKSLGLPQLKLAWTVVSGPADEVRRTLAALDVVADTYLSVGTPVQHAIPKLLAYGEEIRRPIRSRLANNLAAARRLAAGHPACSVLSVEGGWSLVVRVPAASSEERLVQELVVHEQVLVHPGYFFDFSHEAHLVVSLLLPERVFADAFARTLRFASERAS